MREGLYTLNEDLVVETLPNSVFNYLVSHVVPRADNGDVGVLSAVQAQLEHGITRLVQELEWWMADGAVSSATKVGLTTFGKKL